jgi:antitoxin (DNA-binding transcriptional repressor) of toxin-antitoxin stability system
MCHNASVDTTTVGMRDLHLFTRSVLETVRKVGVAIVTDRGRPIAKIVALTDEEAELIQAGGVTPARPRFAMPTRQVPEGGPSATEALLAMREDDRV